MHVKPRGGFALALCSARPTRWGHLHAGEGGQVRLLLEHAAAHGLPPAAAPSNTLDHATPEVEHARMSAPRQKPIQLCKHLHADVACKRIGVDRITLKSGHSCKVTTHRCFGLNTRSAASAFWSSASSSVTRRPLNASRHAAVPASASSLDPMMRASCITCGLTFSRKNVRHTGQAVVAMATAFCCKAEVVWHCHGNWRVTSVNAHQTRSLAGI